MPDKTYCYDGSEVLINKLNIRDGKTLFQIEKQLTAIRLLELQKNPIKGSFDFDHLKAIHKYIFQDIYSWAGNVRTVEIGKGNLFCTTACIHEYADSVFAHYYFDCLNNKDDRKSFVKVFAENYGNLNALHPFREGNGRAQREFARLVCMQCGYGFRLTGTTHEKMLNASKLSFDLGDNSGLIEIFTDAVIPLEQYNNSGDEILGILSSDDLSIEFTDDAYYYGYSEYEDSQKYNVIFKEKIKKMNQAD